MKILVTGGSGFIGSNFIHYWMDRYPNDFIVNLDKLTYAGHESSLKDIEHKSNYKFIQGDICDSNIVNLVMDGVELIVHFAAETHVDRSISGPAVFIKSNILGTQVLLDSALKHGVKRFNHVSTDEVFGALDLNSKSKFKENTNYNPRSPYSASKAASDHLVRAYYYTYQLPITVTNCSNNFGPFQDPEKFIPRMITNLIDGDKIKIYGDGKYVRDWLYVTDHCSAIEKVINHGKIGETYLIGGLTEDVDNLEVTQKILNIFNKDDSSIDFIKDRPGHDRRYAVDWSKINKELGWSPENDFDEWLIKTVDWYKENEWWWRPLKKISEDFYAKR